MALTEAQLTAIRAWVGSDPTDDELDERYDRLESYDALVIETLNAKLAALAEQPSSLSVPGLSISYGQNMTVIQDTIKRFRASGGLGLDEISNLGFFTSKVTRFDPR